MPARAGFARSPPHLDTMRVVPRAAEGEGAYVCGSAREEFGLAVIEVLGADLVHVRPDAQFGGMPETRQAP